MVTSSATNSSKFNSLKIMKIWVFNLVDVFHMVNYTKKKKAPGLKVLFWLQYIGIFYLLKHGRKILYW